MAQATEHLLIFARLPEPGKTKTRLIGAFGAERATELYRALAQRSLTTAQRFAAERGCALTVCFSGGDAPAIIDRQLGLGRVVTLNTTANDAWSDLPRRYHRTERRAMGALGHRGTEVPEDRLPLQDHDEARRLFRHAHRKDHPETGRRRRPSIVR